MTRERYWNASLAETSKAISGDGGPIEKPRGFYNLISSLCCDGVHRPALDVDIPFGPVAIAAIEACRDHIGCFDVYLSRNGRCHVYGSVSYPDADYHGLLAYLSTIGLIEPGYAFHSRERGQSLLRVPFAPPVFRSQRCSHS